MNNARAISLLCALALAAPLFAWRSELYPESWSPADLGNFYTDKVLQDFSYAGYKRGEEEIPVVTGPVFTVTDAAYGADNSGTNDATKAIQKAIDAACSAGGGVVYLPAGTYKVNPTSYDQALHIYKSGVVLRGAGPDKTFILNTTSSMRSKSIIRAYLGDSWKTPASGPNVKISSDLMKPTRAIPVASVSGFAKGDWIVVRTDMTESWISEHGETEWSGYTSNFSGLVYLRQIDSIDASTNTIHIDAPTRYAIKTRDNARVYKAKEMLENVGLEDFSIANVQNSATTGYGEEDYKTSSNASYSSHNAYAIKFAMVRNGWISNVKSYKPPQNTTGAHLLANGIGLDWCRNLTIRKCHFGHPQYGGGGGNGYMYRVESQDVLFDTDSATYARHGFVLSHMHAAGNVFWRCADKDGGHQHGGTGSGSTSGRGNDHHMHFSHSNLFDGCSAENSNFQAAYRPYGSTPKHNLTAAHSVYWNMEGKGNDGDTWVVHTQQARYGYAIGTRGTVTNVNTGAVGNSSAKTAPVDHVEGIANGSSLEPQSLYRDQLARRKAREKGRSPYGQVPTARVQAENYDDGGEGVSWHESDQGNNGFAWRTDDVDLQRTSDGTVVLGWTAAGEWTEYTVELPASGKYALRLRTSSKAGAGALTFSVDGETVAGPLVAPNTGDYQVYEEWEGVSGIALEAGRRVVRMEIASAGLNVDWFEFEPLPPEEAGGDEGEGEEETAVSPVVRVPGSLVRIAAEGGTLSVSGMPDGVNRVELYAADGRLLDSRTVFGSRAEFDLPGAAGSLLVRASGAWGSAARRLASGR